MIDIEKIFVAETFSGRTRSWDDIVINRLDLASLPEGTLRNLIINFRAAYESLNAYLERLGYEAG